MFIENQSKSKKDYYSKMLQTVGSLSKLFSESDEPYLHYRVAENLFCKSFGAENLSRSDTSADASFEGIGIGLKTFLQSKGKKMEKVAQFNSASSQFRNLPVKKQVFEIARLRNERIETTKKIYGLHDMIYHCVTRTKGKISIIETPMHLVDIGSIKLKTANHKSINFTDKFNEYSYNISNSTLLKRFVINGVLKEIPVEIINDPFEILEQLFSPTKKEIHELVFEPVNKIKEHVFLPLYSTRDKENKKVPKSSGLNQWKARGRKRSLGEVYIPIPAWIHRNFEGFFPPKNKPFSLHLPNKQILSAKVCQSGNKALMTNPNEALGQWILRDVLNLKEGEILTYKKLEDIGLDTVVVYKDDEENYRIDFAKIGAYDNFEAENVKT